MSIILYYIHIYLLENQALHILHQDYDFTFDHSTFKIHIRLQIYIYIE